MSPMLRPRNVHRVSCSLCDRALFTVTDTRFGAAPPSVLCRSCTLPAFRHLSGAGA